jgi:hypothetical protein
MDTNDYEVVPEGGFARFLPMVFGGLLMLGLLVATAINYDQPEVLAGLVPSLFALVAVLFGFAWVIRNPRVRLKDGELQVGRFPRLLVRASQLDLAAARVVDLGNETNLQPVIRLMGTSVPGLQTGWFWLRDRSRAFLLVTDRRRVLVLPRRDGGPVLLSLVRPESLLDALRRARG